ncbi:hypothetical protein IMG5_128270 [Ichthyophthirius multifiliis]|uniref:Schlafen AlbA-2 domain-containing protein n=1 Tax=Ichthyophthirius multifiliis TaxID=5932 RepID=G0QW03_ICHMU|nr:hypothetical protein IMG5_128270 [Ichthyophthirius multifiliis]EGR30596.1 hypothetical protein IMG5_128270 [Ichthyophthirius multifiliis]|eukprot:XP_004032183.1 hypothetical protein IMG5_128270 [Ichthyophthirius multifiliis]
MEDGELSDAEIEYELSTQAEKTQNIKRECCRSFYYYHEILQTSESNTIDYKQYSWPIVSPQITRKLAIEILSFLNTNGGAILIGITDLTYKVIGIKLFLKQREEFTKYTECYRLSNKLIKV